MKNKKKSNIKIKENKSNSFSHERMIYVSFSLPIYQLIIKESCKHY